MPIYVSAQTQQSNDLFSDCGSKAIAGNLANTTSVAGQNYCFVYHYQLHLSQPMNHFGSQAAAAPFEQELVLILPNYQPIQPLLFNVSNEHQTISNLTLNITRRESSKSETLIGQLTGKNGVVKSFNCSSGDQLGQLCIRLLFEKLTHEDKQTQKSGVLQTNR